MAESDVFATRAFERGLEIAARVNAGWVPTARRLEIDYGVSRATAYRMLRGVREVLGADGRSVLPTSGDGA